MPARGELPLHRPEEADRVEDDATGDVRAVESGEREKDAGEDAVARKEPELRVLVALANEEQDAEHERWDEPVSQPLTIAALDRVHGELPGHARDQEPGRGDGRRARAA